MARTLNCKIILLALLALFGAGAAHAQSTVSVTGNLRDLGANGANQSNTYVQFTLQNFGANIPRVTATNLVVPGTFQITPNSLGALSGAVQPNDTITPAGTNYQVCVFYRGIQFQCNNFIVLSTTNPFNLNSAAPMQINPNLTVRNYVITNPTGIQSIASWALRVPALILGSYTVATIPTPTALIAPAGSLAVITDGTAAGDCTVGGGTAVTLCRNNGVAWIAIGGGGGGGGSSITTCMMGAGQDGGAAITTTDIQPQRSQCDIPFTAVVTTVLVKADAGASTVQVGGRHNGAAYALSPLLTPATVIGVTDKVACANTDGSAIVVDGVNVTCSTLAATGMTSGDSLETIGGAADGTTKRLSVAVMMTGNGTGGGGGGGSGSVTSVGTTLPLTGGPVTASGSLACPTCTTSAAALTNNQLVSGAGAQGTKVNNLSGDVTTSNSMVTTIAPGVVTEAKQLLADNTTQNASTARHGYVPKLPGDATLFYNGVGAFVAGSGASVSLRTNSVVNPTQTILNLTQGSGMSLTDNGSGQITLGTTTLGTPFAGAVPWTDVMSRAYGTATCNLSGTGDTAAFNAAYAANFALGSLTYLPNGCIITPPSPFAAGSFLWHNIALGGNLGVTDTLGLRAWNELKCDNPGQQNIGVGGFSGIPFCSVYGLPATVSPIVKLKYLDSQVGPFHLKNIGVLNPDTTHAGTQVGLEIETGAVNFILDNVNISSARGNDIPMIWTGFGQMRDGQITVNDPFNQGTLPGIRFDSHAGVPGTINLQNVFFQSRGIYHDWKEDSGGGVSGANMIGGYAFYENTVTPFWTENVRGGSTGFYEFNNVAMADGGSSAIDAGTFIKIEDNGSECSGCITHGSMSQGNLFNVQPSETLFQLDTTNATGPLNLGVNIFNLDGNRKLGLLDANDDYNLIQGRYGNIFQTRDSTNPALASSGVGVQLTAPRTWGSTGGTPNVCTPSSSGGTLAAGTYYLIAYYEGKLFDGTTGLGLPSLEQGPFTLTGSTSSFVCHFGDGYPPASSAIRYYTSTTGRLREDRYYRTTAATDITITGAGAVVADAPLHPTTTNLALTTYWNQNGDSWTGTQGNVGIGTTTPTKKLDVNGTLGVSGAATFDTITVNTCAGCVPSYSVSDDFNGADAATLGANWTTVGALTSIGIASHGAQATAMSGSAEFYSAISAVPTDQCSAAVIRTDASASDYMGVGSRMDASSGGYTFLVIGPSGVSGHGFLQKIAGGGALTTYTLGSQDTVMTITNGDEVKICSQGTTHTAYVNNVAKISATDTTYTVGKPGLFIFNTTGTFTNSVFESWTGASIVSFGDVTITGTATTNNLVSAGAVNFGGASSIKLPFSAGLATTTNGNVGYDTTGLNWRAWQNGANRIVGVFDGTTIVNGDCVQIVKSGNTVNLQDAGAVCGGGGGGGGTFTGITNGTNTTAAMVVGSGATLGVSGTGSITATALASGSITSAQLAAALTDETGTGVSVFATSPTLVTPVLGVATATSINKMAITAPATSSTLAVADGKTLTASNTLTLAGTDSTVITFQGTDTYVGRATADTLTNKTLTAPVIATIVNTGTLTLPTSTDTLVGRATTDTLTNKTLTTPIIASFTNATHNHTNAAGGGQLTDSALSTAVGMAKGGTGLTTAADDTVLISSGSAYVATAIPGCLDTGSNHLNYNASTNTISCGTAGGSGTVTSSGTPTSGQAAEYTTATNIIGVGTAGGGASYIKGTFTSPVVGDFPCFNSTPILVNCKSGTVPNVQTGATYTVASTDRNAVIEYSRGTAIAVTLPQAGTAGFTNNFTHIAHNGGAGAVTYTPTPTSTINGNSTLVITQGQTCAIYSDNTNYQAYCNSGQIAAGTGLSSTPSATGTTLALSTVAIANGGTNTTSPGPSAITDAATLTFDAGSALIASRTVLFTVHSGSRTLNAINMVTGGQYVGIFTQDSSGTGEGLTLGTGCTWKVSGSGAGAVTPSTGANKTDILAWYYDGTNCWANFNKDFN
jgi:hypothetical protein